VSASTPSAEIPRPGSADPAEPPRYDSADSAASIEARDNAALAARLRLTVMRLTRRLRSQAGNDLSPSLLAALASLERHGPLTLGQLATLERIKPPSITRMVATLESAGLVARESEQADRRVTVVNVTAAGRRTLQKSRTRKTAYLAKRLRALSDTEAATLDDALRLLERLLEDD
jgi:DNA-binding MarR family transcriptional regulator